MARQRWAFTDFSAGDYGRRWPAENTPAYRAVNVIPYPNGGIGPRPPLKALNLLVDAGPNTPVTNQLPERALIFAHNDLLLTDDGHMWNAVTGERAATPVAHPRLLRDYTENWFGELTCVSEDAATQPGGHIRQLVGVGLTRPEYVTRPAAPSGNRIEQYADVFVIGRLRALFWSNPLNFDAWGADDWAPTPQLQLLWDMVRQRNTLVLMVGAYDVTGSDGSTAFLSGVRGSARPGVHIYIVTGTLGGGAVMRRVTTGSGPADAKFGGMMGSINGELVYWFQDRWMMTFDGAEITTHDAPLPRILHSPANYNYGPLVKVPFWSSAVGKFQNEFVLATSLGHNGGNESATPSPFLRRGVFVWQHGAPGGGWTAHDPGIEFRSEVRAGVAGAGIALRGDSDFYVYNRLENSLIFATQGRSTNDGNGAPQRPRLYEMSLTDSFPDVSANDGDTAAPVKADFRTADTWDEDGGEITVRTVVIDYSYTAGASSQTLKVSVEALQLWDGRAPTVSAEQTLAPSGGTPSEPGSTIIRGRQRFSFGDQGAGNGFRIRLSDWSGIMIHRILVDGDVSRGRG